MFEELNQRRQAVIDNINKSFSEDAFDESWLSDIEKAHNVGDILYLNGKTYIYKEYKHGAKD